MHHYYRIRLIETCTTHGGIHTSRKGYSIDVSHTTSFIASQGHVVCHADAFTIFFFFFSTRACLFCVYSDTTTGYEAGERENNPPLDLIWCPELFDPSGTMTPERYEILLLSGELDRNFIYETRKRAHHWTGHTC